MYRRLLCLIFVALLTACANLPPPSPRFSIARGARVGVFVALPSSAVHEHVGTTVFNNFSTRRTLPFDLPSQAKADFSAALKSAGFEAVDLGASGFSASAINALVVPTSTGWQVNPAQAAAFEKLRKTLQLSAVVVVYGERTLAQLQCTGGPCTEWYVQTSGLFTRSVFNLTRYYAVPAFQTKVFVLGTPVELSAFNPIAAVQKEKVKLLSDMAGPKDFKNLTQTEFAPVSNWIGSYLKQIATASATAIASGPRP
jgi:hypothetical protein